MAELKPKQEKLIIALMSKSTMEEAVEAAGITKNTAYKYLKDPVFSNEYRRIRRENMQQVTSKLQHAAILAVETLLDVMEDKELSTPSARVQASRAVLENAYKGIEMDDLQQRIEQLEERLGDSY
ncbi:phage replication protein [Desemzia incerta]|uniref:phage replication protein n=1 Tax=Desemzia incerta TaxID=82801 RepID=UPI003D080527